MSASPSQFQTWMTTMRPEFLAIGLRNGLALAGSINSGAGTASRKQVSGPSHSAKVGKTPVLDPQEARQLLVVLDFTAPTIHSPHYGREQLIITMIETKQFCP